MPKAKKKDLYRYYLTVTAADGSKRRVAYSSTDANARRPGRSMTPGC